MQSDFFPDQETLMLSWTANFAKRLSLDPAAYGVTAEQAAWYGTLQVAFAQAMAGNDPANRSRTTVAAKNTARDAVRSASRQLSKVIQGQPLVTDAQRAELGLSIRKPSYPRLPVPTEIPTVYITEVQSNRLTLSIASTAGGRPRGVAGAAILVFIGDLPPRDPRQWLSYGNTSRLRTTIDIDGVSPNTRVWVSARFYNPRGELGPASTPISTYTTHGLLAPPSTMKRAA